MSYTAFLKCDAPGCERVAAETEESREWAFTQVQAKAKASGWRVVADRGNAADDYDLCREHNLELQRAGLQFFVPRSNQ